VGHRGRRGDIHDGRQETEGRYSWDLEEMQRARWRLAEAQ
jgi:hypothetical protein